MNNGQFSSVMLIANDGLLQNQGLALSGNLAIAISDYESTAPVNAYLGILSSAFANVGVGNDLISNSTFTSLQELAANTLPAITDAVPSAFTGTLIIGTSTAGFSGLVSNQANLVLGSGDLGKFAQVYGQSISYISQNNPYINSVKNSDILNPTFTSMDNLTTGSISNVNRTLTAFGEDLVKLGQTWDLSNLEFFGYPSALLYQLTKVGGLVPDLSIRLGLIGISDTDLNNIQSGREVSANVELLIYQIMEGFIGGPLDQVKQLLRVTTANITTMADLLNPVKILPNSYLQLTMLAPTGTDDLPSSDVLTNVYLPDSAVNSNLLPIFAGDDLYINLAKIIPSDQALANRCIARSLQQIKNIFAVTLPEFSTTVLAIESNAGLGDINALTQPVPAGVSSSLNSLLATGTGPNGTLTLFDFMGAAAGIPYTAQFLQAAATLDYMQTANALYYVTDSTDGVFTVMQDTLDGVYTTVIDPGPPADISITIPPGLPGAGTYLTLDDAFTVGLLPAAGNIIANIVANNASNATSLNSNFTVMATQLNAEVNNLALAQIDFNDLAANSRSSIMSLGSNLHEIGKDIAPQGQAEFFTAIADTSNIYGQAIIASFREGRNLAVLDNVGIGADTQIPSTSI
jgi:hypothetical protein